MENIKWPVEIPRIFRPFARLKHDPNYGLTRLDSAAMRAAQRTMRKERSIRNSFTTGTVSELMFSNRADYNALNTFTAEASLLAGLNQQPAIPALFFDGGKAFGRSIRILARGILGTTGTPTYQFTVRLGTTVGSTFLTGTIVGITAAITTGSGVTTKEWQLVMDIICNTPGQGTTNTTLNCCGFVESPAGFASPFIYAVQPTTPESGTWTTTLDNTLTQYVNITCVSSASSASNTLTVKQLMMHGWN
jgi:hypothetical protein